MAFCVISSLIRKRHQLDNMLSVSYDNSFAGVIKILCVWRQGINGILVMVLKRKEEKSPFLWLLFFQLRFSFSHCSLISWCKNKTKQILNKQMVIFSRYINIFYTTAERLSLAVLAVWTIKESWFNSRWFQRKVWRHAFFNSL